MRNIILSGLMLSAAMVSFPNDGLCAKSVPQVSYGKVAGTYQLSGFSGSITPTLAQPVVSEGYVGQATFYKNGTGIQSFIGYTVNLQVGLVGTDFENVPFTYTLGPKNGEATMVVSNFPNVGETQTFAISFKVHDDKVTGFSLVTSASTSPGANLWSIVQGDRFY